MLSEQAARHLAEVARRLEMAGSRRDRADFGDGGLRGCPGQPAFRRPAGSGVPLPGPVAGFAIRSVAGPSRSLLDHPQWTRFALAGASSDGH